MVKIGRSYITDPPKLSNPFAKYIESVGSSKSKLTLPSSSSSSSPSEHVPLKTALSPTSPPCQSSDPPATVPSTENNSNKDVIAQNSFDLTGARGEFENCKNSDEKAKLKARLQPVILDHLHRLSKMEAKSNVGAEIAELVDFFKLLNPSDPKFAEFGNISHTSREGVIRLHEGTLRIKESQEKLQSELAKMSLPATE
ncbi:uncharacterized protein LOC120003922 [Tripterygium wilfordii]|uniref:uncharacterized protein LOC120003922 n=1 Tax=Tripterygium wilfordii TaxID=458696 RepID=UPI0018F7E831|nr:uncharacterized protein LOC120003922 [Tripterygium wilfordii]